MLFVIYRGERDIKYSNVGWIYFSFSIFFFSIFAKYVATIEHELDIWRASLFTYRAFSISIRVWSKNGASKEINFESSSSTSLILSFFIARVADTFDRLKIRNKNSQLEKNFSPFPSKDDYTLSYFLFVH